MRADDFTRFWFAVGFLAVAFLVFLIAAIILYRLGRGSIRLAKRTGSLLDVDLTTQLISFGLANLLFSSVLPTFIAAFFNLALVLLRDAPLSLYKVWQTQADLCGAQGRASDCLAGLGFGAFQAWSSALDKAVSGTGLQHLPYVSLLFLLTAWFLIARLLRPVARETVDGAPSPSSPWLASALLRLNNARRQDLLFFGLLILASYLSIAAIAAIPGLREKGGAAAELSVEKLKQNLDVAMAQLPSATTSDPLVISPFTRLEERLAELEKLSPVEEATSPASGPEDGSAAAAGESTAKALAVPATSGVAREVQVPPPDWLLGGIKHRLDSHKRIWDELMAGYKNLVQQAHKEVNGAKVSAVTIYEVSNTADRQGRREQERHFLQISSWFGNQVRELDGQIDTCASAIDRVSLALRAWAQIGQTQLSLSEQSVDPNWSRGWDERLWPAYDTAFSSCSSFRFRSFREGPPPRPPLGSNLGPFSIVASWLLKTESLPLALIVGLIGFGLLGAACSTFVRERAEEQAELPPERARPSRRRRDAPLVEDLAGVVIRGLSAAIVVFLAVEGGIAIFASGGSEPNPYVLLLTCLIAAVFSETVWEWARRQITDRLYTHRTGRDGEGKGNSNGVQDDGTGKESEAGLRREHPDRDRDAAEPPRHRPRGQGDQ